MGKPFTFLHISDLHRSELDPISNEELISALVCDRDRYVVENPNICVPEAIIVSGDIIQGVPLGTPNFKAELVKQYAVAERFLDELAKRFVSGDRSRVIIVPGNHDVDWNTAFSAMQVVDPSNIPNFGRLLRSERSEYRLDYNTCKAYRIIDSSLYEQRLASFWEFFERFYAGVKGLLKVNSYSDANLFSLHGGRIGVAAFNSCEGNDCFAFHGMIRREAIANSYLELQDRGIFDLRIAVWHHNIEGNPHRTDYMDVDIVRGMIGRNFRLGLYGHQHKAQAAPYQIWSPDTERMAVVSAGSLCAGRNDLPLGTTRQYNILEISEDLLNVKVHVREMYIANLFSKGRFIELGGNSFVELGWESPKNAVGLPKNTTISRKQSTIIHAERAAKEGDYVSAVMMLKEIDLPVNGYERDLYLTVLRETQDWKEIIRVTEPPQNIKELTIRVEAYAKIGDFQKARETLVAYSPSVNLPEAEIHRLRQWIDFLTLMKL